MKEKCLLLDKTRWDCRTGFSGPFCSQPVKWQAKICTKTSDDFFKSSGASPADVKTRLSVTIKALMQNLSNY
jgi:hypothetical protein